MTPISSSLDIGIEARNQTMPMPNLHQWRDSQVWSWFCDRQFQSTIENGCSLIKEFVAALGSSGWEEGETFGAHLAFEEAIMNAIKHGNQLDEQKSVHVTIGITGERAKIQITDQGPGFDIDSVPDPTNEENLHAESGRGIVLIHHFMDEVNYNESGNSVSMVKKRN